MQCVKAEASRPTAEGAALDSHTGRGSRLSGQEVSGGGMKGEKNQQKKHTLGLIHCGRLSAAGSPDDTTAETHRSSQVSFGRVNDDRWPVSGLLPFKGRRSCKCPFSESGRALLKAEKLYCMSLHVSSFTF